MEFYKKLINFFTYHGYSKWNFIYLSFDLTKKFIGFKVGQDLQIKEACLDDLDKIRNDLFPEMVGEQEYEKKYFSSLGESNIKCFICISQNNIIHYSWVFLDIYNSPIVKTPFNRSLLKPGDVYIGPIFTVKMARGLIYPKVLTKIISSLVENGVDGRIMVLVQGLNPAAAGFYKRMGFQVILRPTGNLIFPKIAAIVNQFFAR